MRDPLDKHPHDVDINMLMRLCDVHNVPLKPTNYKTQVLSSNGLRGIHNV